MLELPNVTLIALTNRDIKGHMNAFLKSSEQIKWGQMKLIWAMGTEETAGLRDIPWVPRIRPRNLQVVLTDISIKDINDWNYSIIYSLHEYVETDFALLIHADGYPVNPSAWRPEFLEYDYIGAPWPLPQDDYSYRTPTGELIRVGNSVSLRSKKILQLPSQLGLEWRSYYGNTNEDGFLCVHNRDILKENGIKFAPLEVAKYFSKEHEIPENKEIRPFAFHAL